jgi:hypothetical protein
MVKHGGVYGGRRPRNEQVQEQEALLLAENDVAEQEAIMAGIESMFGHLNAAASGWLPLYLVVVDRDWERCSNGRFSPACFPGPITLARPRVMSAGILGVVMSIE